MIGKIKIFIGHLCSNNNIKKGEESEKIYREGKVKTDCFLDKTFSKKRGKE